MATRALELRERGSDTAAAAPAPPALPLAQGTESPLAFLSGLAAQPAGRWAGFNLVVGDLAGGGGAPALAYWSNRGPSPPAPVPPGVHGLSNALLDTPWPKASRPRRRRSSPERQTLGPEPLRAPLRLPARQVVQGKRRFAERLFDNTSERGARAGCSLELDASLDELLQDAHKAGPADLPQTGVAPELELEFSSIFVRCTLPEGAYGTRSRTVLAVRRNGELQFVERSLKDDGTWAEGRFSFRIPVGGVAVGSTGAA
eukprot:SM000002S05484  [mRNA]  locus=s2:85942:86873:+ [translate_table: standard]